MKRRLVLLGAPVLAAAAAAQAPAIPESAYRRGLPEVLVPAPAAAPQPAFDRAGFASAYARAGRPAIAVLWNRQFTDSLQQSSAQQVRIDSVHAGGASRESVRGPGYGGSEVAGAVAGSTVITTQTVRGQQEQRAAPAERVDLEMRSAFVQALVAAGVRVVDRSVVMRTTAAKDKGSLDSQQVETEALGRHASLLMEVLNTRDAASPTGWATHVSIKRLADGGVLAEAYMDGREPQGPSRTAARFEADPNGGFRQVVTVTTPTVADVGRRAAEQALARLAGAL